MRQAEIVRGIRRDLAPLGGVTTSVSTGFNDGQKQIQLQLQGRDSAVLARLADQIMAEVRQVNGAVDVSLSTKGQKPELDVQVDRALAGSLGITVGQIAQALRPAFAGIDAGDWVDPSGETRDVTIRLAPEARTSVGDLETLPLVVTGPENRPARRFRHRTQVFVIGHHGDKIGVETAGSPSENQVVEAVTRPRDHDQDSVRTVIR